MEIKITTKIYQLQSIYRYQQICQFTMAEKDAIINFVKKRGGLYMIADHDNSIKMVTVWDSLSYLE